MNATRASGICNFEQKLQCYGKDSFHLEATSAQMATNYFSEYRTSFEKKAMQMATLLLFVLSNILILFFVGCAKRVLLHKFCIVHEKSHDMNALQRLAIF